MDNLQLPDGWALCSIAEVAKVNPKKIDAGPDLKAGFVPMSHAPTDFNGTLKFDEKQWGEIKKSYTNFQDNDVIFAKVTPCFENGKAAIVRKLPNGIGAGSSEFYVLRPHLGCLSTEYLFGVIKTHSFMQDGAANMTGAVGLRRVPREYVESFPIALPPLAEQKAIAQKLDTLLAQVETTKARLDRIPDILKRFRQSVLAAAVSGKLTEEWRRDAKLQKQSFEEIRLKKQELINSKLIKKDLDAEEVAATFTIPSEWLFLKLQSLAVKITDGEHKTPVRQDCGRYLLSARNVRDGFISTENVDFVGEEEFQKLRKRCDPDKGDVLISCSGSVGRISLVDEDNKYVMVRSAALVKVMGRFIDSQFLMYLLQSPALQKNIDESSKSTAQSNLFLGPIKELGIPLPSLEEQTQIVKQVETLFAHADAIEKQVQAAQTRVNSLTQSILAKAFCGELTADWRAANPELISGENSAEALLAKIKAERDAAKPKKKSRARK